MKTKNLFYALAMGVAFTACSQEEIVNDSANLMKGDSFKNYAGEVFDGNISFTKDGGAESRMAVENGTPSWINGDMVGLVWTNAADGTQTGGWIERPQTSNIYSNTRMTYDANAGNWYMTDGQIFKGMYLAYYPFNEDIQSVQQFAVSQDNVQVQTNSTTETLNEVAEKLVWMSQRYEDDEDVSTNATFVYPFTVDDVESGKGSQINVRMKPFSNILDARFMITKRATPAIDLDPEVVTVKGLKLMVRRMTTVGAPVLTAWPTTAKFDFTKWGWEYEVVSGGLTTLDGRKLSIDGNNGGYNGENKVQWIDVDILDEAPNAGQPQRANFMFLPYEDITTSYADAVYVIRVETDYGYVDIDETKWKKSATNNGGLIVNPNSTPVNSEELVAWIDAQPKVQASNAMNTLTNRIGAQPVRYFNAYAQDFIYNNIKVKNTNELVEAIRKWNVLGRQGTFTVVVADVNEFENLVWSEDATVDVDGETWNTPAAIQEFLADPLNKLNVTVETPTTKVVLNNAVIDDENTLLLNNVTVQSNGKLQVNVDQTIEILNTTAGSELIIPNGGKVVVEHPSLFEGNTSVAQLAELHINTGAAIESDGEFNLSGKLHIVGASGSYTRFINDGVFNLLKHAQIVGVSGTAADEFVNNGTFNYVNNGKKIDVEFIDNGESIAEIGENNKSTALTDYITAADEFGCKTLNILTSDRLEEEWDNSAANLNFEEINFADGVTLKLAESLNAPNAVVTVTGQVTIETVGTAATTQLNIAGFVLEVGATLDITDTLLDINVSGNIEMKGAAGETTTLNGIAQTNKTASQIVKATSGTYAIN